MDSAAPRVEPAEVAPFPASAAGVHVGEGAGEAHPAGFERTPDGTFAPVASAPVARVPAAVAPTRLSARVVTPNPVWAWITGGNLLTRIGVVVLFFLGILFIFAYALKKEYWKDVK